MASNTTSIPEVAGDAALLIDPNKIEAMADALYALVYDDTLRAELRNKGLTQARLFTWDTTAQHMLDLYRSLET